MLLRLKKYSINKLTTKQNINTDEKLDLSTGETGF